MDRALGVCGFVFALVGGVFTAISAVMLPAALRQSLVFLVFPLMGLAFLGLGIGLLSWRQRRRRRCARLLEGGQRIWADLTDVYLDERVTVNGRHPFVLVCQALDPRSGEVCLFRSEGMWYDPTPYLRPGAKVPVFVDPEDWSEHVVDIGAILPPLGR